MKATGIVRRIDDLGRVVIPKEIRRTLRIREGDPLEIFTEKDGEVIFKKYSPMGELLSQAEHYSEVLQKTLGYTTLVCDRDTIICAAGAAKRDFVEKRVSIPLEKIMAGRKCFYHNGKPDESIFPCEGTAKQIMIACPIVDAGDVAGAIMLVSEDKKEQPDEEVQKILQIAAAFLAKQLEA